jgi:hypothetical protein
MSEGKKMGEFILFTFLFLFTFLILYPFFIFRFLGYREEKINRILEKAT